MNDEKLLEQEILASFERGEWRSVRNQKGEIARIRASAEADLAQEQAGQHSNLVAGPRGAAGPSC